MNSCAPLLNASRQMASFAPMQHTDVDRFRAGMSLLGGACTVITSRLGDERSGLTATAVCSVSADPPRLLVCVNRSVRAHAVISTSGVLAVNVLGAEHEPLAKRFAGMVDGARGDDRFLAGDWSQRESGSPVLLDALASFDCRVAEQAESGTHSMFLCDVISVETPERSSASLIYFNRRFVSVVAS